MFLIVKEIDQEHLTTKLKILHCPKHSFQTEETLGQVEMCDHFSIKFSKLLMVYMAQGYI